MSTYSRPLDFLVHDGLVADLLSRMVCHELLEGLENVLEVEVERAGIYAQLKWSKEFT